LRETNRVGERVEIELEASEIVFIDEMKERERVREKDGESWRER